jgi:predicted DNA-binding protein
MTTISLRLPKNYHQRLNEVSSKQGISINQLITNAIGEKLSALDTEDYIQMRANRSNSDDFNEVMDKVKSVKPDKRDSL